MQTDNACDQRKPIDATSAPAPTPAANAPQDTSAPTNAGTLVLQRQLARIDAYLADDNLTDAMPPADAAYLAAARTMLAGTIDLLRDCDPGHASNLMNSIARMPLCLAWQRICSLAASLRSSGRTRDPASPIPRPASLRPRDQNAQRTATPTRDSPPQGNGA